MGEVPLYAIHPNTQRKATREALQGYIAHKI